jgi:putative membrane protein
MDMTRSLALTIHVVGFSTWLVGLFAIALLLADRDAQPEEAFRTRLGQLARKTGRIADIGATIATAGGAWLLVLEPYVLRQPWLHMKLTTVVLGMLGLHGFLRAKAKRASQGQGNLPAAIPPVLAAVALVVIALAVMKPLAR